MGSQIGALIGGLWGDPGQNFVDLQGGPDAVFGKKPQVAPFVPVDLTDETSKAVAGNLQNYPAITDLLNKIYPGFSDILAQGSQNTLDELQGKLPADVAAQVQRSSAFQSLMGGFSGTPMAHALSARDLGLTSLNLTQTGTNAAQQWASVAEQAYSPFTVSTSQQAAVTAANNAGTQANQQFKYNVAAAPDPGAAGIFNVDAALGQQMLSIGGAFLGGSFGGGNSAQTQPTSQWTLLGGQGNAPAYQYNPASGVYQQVPQAQPVQGAWSDRRIKENLRYVRTSKAGHRIYQFSYLNGTTRFEGVIADEVAQRKPEAVYDGGDGYKRVNYNLIDVEFKVLPDELGLEAA